MFLIRKQPLRPRAVVGYGVKIFGPGLFITSPDHLVGNDPKVVEHSFDTCVSISFPLKVLIEKWQHTSYQHKLQIFDG